MIFYLIYYIFLAISYISLPYVVSNYILAGDPYLLANTGLYFYLWLAGIIFIVSYAFTNINYFYYCFISRFDEREGFFDILSGLHNIAVAGIYSALYMTIFAFVGYMVGITAMDAVPQIKEALLSVIHLPGFEFLLKGVPLAIGGVIGNIISLLCVSAQC